MARTASGLAPYDKRWWTLLILSTALLVISLDNTILNVALPTIERELDATSGQLQWIVDSYTSSSPDCSPWAPSATASAVAVHSSRAS